MLKDLQTNAERRATEAEKLAAFGGFNLLHIKREVEILLGLIGSNGIFDQYTRHDITHIDAMLASLDWLIPDATSAVMSPADWLTTVLSIYFHDLGMLVTKEEYNARESSGFPEYREKVLFSGEYGADYRAKVEALPAEECQRFLYQEYVREHHAERVRRWILGQQSEHLGISHAALQAVQELLRPLSDQFRRDLALVCESHHLDDLHDTAKYKISQPYGNSDAETANLQYAAVLLRTADLLHMTGDRTPSIAFKVINPTDPLSQQEWAKQMAVTRIRPQVGLNKEGQPDSKAHRDTIEVFAYFKSEDGFFGLTSYLLYVTSQLQKSNDWVENVARLKGSKYTFPWRRVDDSGIETVGFLRNTYEFTIDQARILDLLTGHTLYNDTRVVLRELIQNSLDAIRLQFLQDQQQNRPATSRRVAVHWDTKERTLTVEDNGTGMTQQIIERHLLRVGSSRYQDPEFKKQFPEFAAISRFGIGVLSAFMVADTVEITTCHPDEEQARQLSLRSVHGKYLIRTLDKLSDASVRGLAPHGTRVRLRVRPSAMMPDPVATARRWVVVPNCEVAVTVNDSPPVQIGFASPKEALADVLERLRPVLSRDQDPQDGLKVRIEQKEMHGVTVAYAVEWSAYFREWSFLPVPTQTQLRDEKIDFSLGTCIGGIRVDFDTPGFVGAPILAISNASGLSAPKTNVARSGLETTAESSAMLSAIYSIYCGHIANEIESLYKERSFSLTWAMQESRFLLAPILKVRARDREDSRPVSSDLLLSEVLKLPLLVVERDGRRESTSPAQISKVPSFWTIDSAFFRSAEMLIREVPGPVSISALGNALGTHNLHLPDGAVICSLPTTEAIEEQLFAAREVTKILVYPDQRRADFLWEAVTPTPRWVDLLRLVRRHAPDDYLRSRPRSEFRGFADIKLGRGPATISGVDNTLGVISMNALFLLPSTPLTKFLVHACEEVENQPSRMQKSLLLVYVVEVLTYLLRWGSPRPLGSVSDFLRSIRDMSPGRANFAGHVTDAELVSFEKAITESPWEIFNPSAWVRKEPSSFSSFD